MQHTHFNGIIREANISREAQSNNSTDNRKSFIHPKFIIHRGPNPV